MGLANNDYNWRLVAGEAIPANTAVTISAAGKVVKAGGATAGVVGIVPQPIAVGERCPVMRGGTIAELVGLAAGARVRYDTAGALVTSGTNPIIAVVKSEDTTLAVILSGNLDAAIA
jgi:hypothetical protein